jgi:hypothetical protein
MTTMQNIVLSLLFFFAFSARTLHGVAIPDGIASPNLATNAGDMTLAQFNDVSDEDNFSRMIRMYTVTLELLTLEKKELDVARKKLAALEHEPGISHHEKKRLQEKQKQIGLQIGALEMVVKRLILQSFSKIWRRLCFCVRKFFFGS